MMNIGGSGGCGRVPCKISRLYDNESPTAVSGRLLVPESAHHTTTGQVGQEIFQKAGGKSFKRARYATNETIVLL